MRLQSIAARASFALFLLAALIACVAVGGTRLAAWDAARGYRLMMPSAILTAIAFLAGALWLFLALRRNSGAGKRLGLIGLFGAALLLYGPAGFVYRGLAAPPIGDATTDPESAPRFTVLRQGPAAVYHGGARIRFHGRTMTLAYLQHEYYPELARPNGVLVKPAVLFWHGFETAKKMGWNIVSFDAGQGRIEAVATSFWFGRKTDIAIRVKPAGTLGARLDIRAASDSADGNVQRIKAYLKLLEGR